MKTLNIYHSRDLDGWCSAAIVKYWHNIEKNKLAEANSLGFNLSEIDFIGWDYGQPIPNWKIYDEIIMCDISFKPEEMNAMIKAGKKLIWLDHHNSSILDVYNYFTKEKLELPDGIRNEKFAACELTWQYFFKDIPTPKAVEYLGLYDSFRHKAEMDAIGQQEVLEFQYAARSYISELQDFPMDLLKSNKSEFIVVNYIKDGKAIYHYLLMDAREIYKKKIEIIIDGYKFCGFNAERFNPINFKIDYHKDGYDGALCFWYDKEKSGWNFSFYNDNSKVDCSLIAKKYGGGGHVGASGAVIKDNPLEDYIKNLLKI